MLIFVSWSGETSRKLAQCMSNWLPDVVPGVDTYFTPSDIEKGQVWRENIASKLKEGAFGIICLTRDNLNSAWILFEAGALFGKLSESRVCPLLFGIKKTDIRDPLAQFQATEFDEEEVLKLVSTINNHLGDQKRNEERVKKAFSKFWPDLTEKASAILSQAALPPAKAERNDRDILEEILTLARESSRALGSVHSAVFGLATSPQLRLRTSPLPLGGLSRLLETRDPALSKSDVGGLRHLLELYRQTQGTGSGSSTPETGRSDVDKESPEDAG